MSKNFCDWDVRGIIRVSFRKYFEKMWAGGRYLHFEAEINQAFQVLETRLQLSDYILAHNTFRSRYSFVPDAFWGW